MKEIVEINKKMAAFAEKVPAKGMHLSYLDKASEVMNLYGEALSIMDEEQNPEKEAKMKSILKEIEEIIK